jgi:hypothetical protein
MVLKTRRLRTQLGRIDDLIAARENAINKTHEQQTDTPAVSVDHSTTINHLKRSTECATNALAALRQDLQDVFHDDRTFVVKELEEEGRIAYCENLRLNKKLQDSKAEESHSGYLLQVASFRASPQNTKELDSQVRSIRGLNAELRGKALAYSSKRQKIEIEKLIIEHGQNGPPVDSRIKQANDKKAEVLRLIKEKEEALAQMRGEFDQSMNELREIIDRQREAIVDHLRGLR